MSQSTSFEDLEAVAARLFADDHLGWLRWKERPWDHACTIRSRGGLKLRWFNPVAMKWGPADIDAAKMAWFMHTGRWPQRLGVRGPNPYDIRVENLYEPIHDLI